MSYPVKGKDVVIEMRNDDLTYTPILCGEDCSFSRTPEFIPVTSTDSGLFREFMVRREEWSMSVNGLTKIENDTTLTFFYLLQTSVRRQLKTVRITFTDEDGDDKQIEGQIYIGQMDINGPEGDFAKASIEFKGSGAFTVSSVNNPVSYNFDIISDYWQTTNGQDYVDGVSASLLITLQTTDEVIGAFLEGTEYDLVGSTPSAMARECQFLTSPSARVLFPVTFDGTQRVFLILKRPV